MNDEVKQPGAPSPVPLSGASGEAAEPSPRSPGLGDFFWVGTACALSVVIAGAGGYFLDVALGTAPWLAFAGLAFGIIAAVMIGYKELRKYT